MDVLNIKETQNSIKEQALIMILKQLKKVAICFSGGLDSMVLLIEAFKTLGIENVLAITGVSPIVLKNDIAYAKKITSKYGIRHILVERDEMENVDFIRNDENRCYFCKKSLLTKVQEVASLNGFDKILDGTNLDDVFDYRPGSKALKEFSVISPLKDARIKKNDVHAIAKKMGFADYNRSSGSCFATRVPYFEPITYDRIGIIAMAENFLHSKGFNNVRARYHDSLVKIEVDENDIARIMEKSNRLEINEYMKSIGFTWTSVDIIGYRVGSMNENL